MPPSPSMPLPIPITTVYGTRGPYTFGLYNPDIPCKWTHFLFHHCMHTTAKSDHPSTDLQETSHAIEYITENEWKSNPDAEFFLLSTIDPPPPILDPEGTRRRLLNYVNALRRYIAEIPTDFWTTLCALRPDKIVTPGLSSIDDHSLPWGASQAVIRHFAMGLLERVHDNKMDSFKGIFWNGTLWKGKSLEWTSELWPSGEHEGAAKFTGMEMKDRDIWDEVDENTVVILLGKTNPWRQLLGAWIAKDGWAKAPAGVLCVPFEESGVTKWSRDEKAEELGKEMEERYQKWTYWKETKSWSPEVVVERLAMYVRKG